MTEKEQKMWEDDLKMISKLNTENKELREKLERVKEKLEEHFIGEEIVHGNGDGKSIYYPYYYYEEKITEEDVRELLDIINN